MSTEVLPEFVLPEGAPELTALGKRLEILRIERGVSKQRLARHAGTSRQQLWRVMTGKSELTSSLRDRLPGALPRRRRALTSPWESFVIGASVGSQFGFHATLPVSVPTVSDYLVDAGHVAATLRTL